MALPTAITTARQSVIVARPKSTHTVRMIAAEALFTPSKKAENNFDRRIRGNSGCDKATNTKEGRKIANVANAADCHPPICQPINVTDDNTGPGDYTAPCGCYTRIARFPSRRHARGDRPAG